jgi:hypothetical protein
MRKPDSALRGPGKAVCPPEGPGEGQGPSAPLGQNDNRSQNAAWNGEGSIPVPLAPPNPIEIIDVFSIQLGLSLDSYLGGGWAGRLAYP